VCAANGWGCAKNPRLALSCVEKASQTGDLTAIRKLGRFYDDGIGCQVDQERAFALYQKAVVADDPLALYVL
jgi:TPR repeat protein